MNWKTLRTTLLACLLASSHVAAAPPNVLFIAIDDLNDWVGCLGGHPQARAPNLDRLPAPRPPLCNPSPTGLPPGLRLSTPGLYGPAPGLPDVDATRICLTLPQFFAAHGYFTATFGKVFHDDSTPPRLRPNEFNVWGPAPGMPLN